jgi:hypothetical protein
VKKCQLDLGKRRRRALLILMITQTSLREAIRRKKTLSSIKIRRKAFLKCKSFKAKYRLQIREETMMKERQKMSMRTISRIR